ncbi:MAG: PIN domain-containing protein [Candidatus Diapherotrites archaeon]
MELVVDANIAISALISDKGRTKELLFASNLKLYAPEFLLEEIREHEEEICKKAGLSKMELALALLVISSRIEFIPFAEFKQNIVKAKAICPDKDDVLYFALAIKYDCQLWSNDKKLQEQKEVKILSTQMVAKKVQR